MSANIPLACRYPNAYLRVRTATDFAGNVSVYLEFHGLPPSTTRISPITATRPDRVLVERTVVRAYYHEPLYFREWWWNW